MYSADISITPMNPVAYNATSDPPLIVEPLPAADGTTTSAYVDAAQLVKSQGM